MRIASAGVTAVLVSVTITLAAPAASAPEWARAALIGIVPMGSERFELDVKQGRTPPGVNDEEYVRFTLESICQIRPHAIPENIGLLSRKDPKIGTLLVAAEQRLRAAETRLRPLHLADADYSNGWSSGLQDDINRDLQDFFVTSGMADRLWELHLAHSKDPKSCQSMAFPLLTKARLARKAPVPETEQWKLAIGICSGPAGSVEGHIVFRLADPRVSPVIRGAVEKLVASPRFKRCLSRAIDSVPDLARSVSRIDHETATDDLLEAEARVYAVWNSIELPALIQRISTNSASEEEIGIWLRRCSAE